MRPIARHAGTLATIIAVSGILIASALDPSFSWTSDALSDLGVREVSESVFNGSLLLAGLLGTVYAAGIIESSSSRWDIAVGTFLGLATLNLAGVGYFVAGHPLHLPTATAFYTLFTIALAIDGIQRRATRTGRVVLSMTLFHIVLWSTWLGGLWPIDGLAIPEFAGAILLLLWIWVVGPDPTISGRLSKVIDSSR